MKVFFKNFKKSNKLFLFIYLFTFIIYLISYFSFTHNLLTLSGIETFIRIFLIIIFGLWLVTYLLWNLHNLLRKKHIALTILTIITLIFVFTFNIVNHYMDMIYTGIDNLTENTEVTYTSNLVTLKDTNITKKSKLGMINTSDDIEGNVLAQELIKKHKLTKNELIEYSSYYEMIYALLNKEVDGIFLNSNYMTIFGNEEGFENLINTSILYSYSKKMKNQDTTIVSNKKLTEPFTILLMGVDSEANGLDSNTSFNGDTLMLITFNPKTLNATMFSIPRDTYVPIACNNHRYAKINSSAAYGTSCVIDTVEQLTDINIDYYVKINFKGVVDLVEALGGIDVFVEPPDYSAYIDAHNGKICEQNSLRQFGDNLICMDTGNQHLDGEQALAYARCRHAYLQSDIARTKHQQQIIDAIAKKVANPDNINRVEELFDAVTNNLATNMSKKQMLSFYNVLKDMVIKSLGKDNFVNIQKTYLEYYNLPVRLSANGAFASAIGYYPDSLKAITKLMKINLELEEKTMIKTFSFDAFEDYTTKVTGQGIYTGTKLETMPNFIGKSINEAKDWAEKHNIAFNSEFVDNSSPYYNHDTLLGVIANQSYAYGLLINDLTELTVYINNVNPDIVNDTNSNNDLDNNSQESNNKEELPDVIFPDNSSNNEN